MGRMDDSRPNLNNNHYIDGDPVLKDVVAGSAQVEGAQKHHADFVRDHCGDWLIDVCNNEGGYDHNVGINVNHQSAYLRNLWGPDEDGNRLFGNCLANLQLGEVPVVAVEGVQDLGAFCARLYDSKLVSDDGVPKKRRGRPRKKGPHTVAEHISGIGKDFGVSNVGVDHIVGDEQQSVGALKAMEIRDRQAIGRSEVGKN
ncbi:pseudaminic acid cytidylyltransferase [Sesbania bispinosa]|nr:pseudaminic acid cytidylyltransferase [Sesbania bispinosa]